MNGEIDLQALCSLTYGLYIVTSHNEEKLNGQIANTVVQVAMEPPRIAVSISPKNLTHEYIAKSGVFAVSVLEEATPMKLIGLFGFRSGREIDKLSQVAFKKSDSGCPIVTENALSVIEAKVIGQVDVSSHTIFIADVTAAEALRQGRPLTYAYYQECKMGKTPESAPTFRPHAQTWETAGGEKQMQKYVCDVCGYVYDPAVGDPENDVAPGTSFEDLPDDWTCPVCGVGKDQFSPEE